MSQTFINPPYLLLHCAELACRRITTTNEIAYPLDNVPIMTSLPSITQQHLDKIRGFYETQSSELSWSARSYRKLLAHYYNLLIPPRSSVLEIGCASGALLSEIKAARKVGVDLSATQIEAARKSLPAD